jgi:ankyrin repeat protein
MFSIFYSIVSLAVAIVAFLVFTAFHVSRAASRAHGRMRQSMLCHFASGGDSVTAADLLAMGADVDDTDVDGYTPLWMACISDRIDVVRLLLLAGADVNKVSHPLAHFQIRSTPLYAACIQGHESIARLLIEQGADVDAPGEPYNLTPLHAAVEAHSAEIVDLLIASGANVQLASAVGATPLHLALQRHDPCIVDSLLRAGARTDDKDSLGYIPLYHAVRCYHQEGDCLRRDAAVSVARAGTEFPDWEGDANLACPEMCRALLPYASRAQVTFLLGVRGAPDSPVALLAGFDQITKFIVVLSLPRWFINEWPELP